MGELCDLCGLEIEGTLCELTVWPGEGQVSLHRFCDFSCLRAWLIDEYYEDIAEASDEQLH